jgi:CelD/BcsL family acetyltransferase involved in cellulose biosynthesis
VNIQVIESVDQWATVADEWDLMVADQPLHSHAWLSSWWTAFGEQAGRLAVACVRHREQVIGLAPFFVSHSWMGKTVRFLGSGTTCTDYLDIFCEPGYSAVVAEHLVGWLSSGEFRRKFGRIDLVELEGHLASAPGVSALGDRLQSCGWSAEVTALDSCWVVPLQQTWDDYLSGLSARSRKRARQALKLQERGDIDYQTWSDPESIRQIWPKFIELHQNRRQDKGQAGCFREHQFETFIERAVAQLSMDGRASVVGVLHQGQPISLGLLLHGDRRNFLYQTGMDGDFIKLEPGHLLNALTIHQSWSAGRSHFDFLRGDEPYKARWAAEPAALVRSRYWNFHISARVRANLIRAGRMLKHWAQPAKPVLPQETRD